MLRVTYEVIPFGEEDHPNRRVVAVQTIGQEELDSMDIGTYTSTMNEDNAYPGVVAPETRLYHHRGKGALRLVYEALKLHFGD